MDVASRDVFLSLTHSMSLLELKVSREDFLGMVTQPLKKRNLGRVGRKGRESGREEGMKQGAQLLSKSAS